MHFSTSRTLHITVVTLFLSTFGASSRAWPSPDPADASKPAAKTDVAIGRGKLPLSFEPNKGQVGPQVQFLSRGLGYDLFLTRGRAVLNLQVSNPRPHAADVGMRLLGARGSDQPVGEKRLPGFVNYFRGNDPRRWRTHIETFAEVRYPSAYPGIDLVYYGNQGKLEYDFVVSPGADPTVIRLAIEGAIPRVDADGDLILRIAHRELRFRKPVVYQPSADGKDPVKGRFVLASNKEIRFGLGSYDRRRPLVIDPVLVYSSYLGGTSQQTTINGMAMNANGQMYVTGVTNALDLPTTTGVIFPHCPAAVTGSTKCGASSQSAAFVSKISADGASLIYSTYLGGDGSANGGEGADVGVAVAVDSNDNAYVVGTTYSNNFPVTPDAFQSVCSPIAADFNFNTVVNEGKKAGCAGFNGGGEYIYGQQDIFLVKLNPTGSQILYGTFLGGSQNDVPDGVALDAAGNIYLSGSTSSASTGTFAQSGQFNYPVTASAFQSLGVPGSFVTFITVLTADGQSLLYSSVIGGIDVGTSGNSPPANTGSALAVNPATGIAYIAGFSRSATFPVTAGAFQATCPADANGACPETAFVAAFDPTKAGAASLVYSTRLSGTVPALPTTHVNGIAVDSTGNAYVTGTTQANDFPTTAGALQPACSHVNPNGCNDAFVTKINPTGTAAVWSTLYGSASGCCNVSGSAITVDANQNVFVAGTNGGAFDLAQKAPFPFQASEHGGQDVFLLELNAAGSQILFGSYFGGTGGDIPSSIAVDSNANVFVAGQTSSADLPVSANAFDKALSGGFATGFLAMVSTVGGVAVDAGAGDTGGTTATTGDAKGTEAGTGGTLDAGSAPDAGGPPDAVGTPDAGFAGGDAAPAPTDTAGGKTGSSKQGGGCRIASSDPPAATVWLLAIGVLLLARRLQRRTSSASPGSAPKG